ncbi:MAG: hypothetical protein JWM58_3346 [Rhizobium sp.]|nr:hypothetical protein [Rhizobium sp.]
MRSDMRVKSAIKLLLLALPGLAILPAPVLGQAGSCAYRPSILTLSDRLLADLDSKDASVARFYGRDAAYLKMNYGEMGKTQVDAMLDRLMDKRSVGATAFSYAYYLSKLGYDAAGAKMGARLDGTGANALDLTLMRALAKAGRYDLVLDRVRGVMQWPDKRYLIPMALPFIDNPPDERKRLADLADKSGAPLLAGQLYASLPNYDPWKGFLKRNFENIGFYNLKASFVAFSAFNFDSPPVPDPRNHFNGVAYRQSVQKFAAASWFLPGSALLYEFSAKFRFEPIYGKRAALKLKEAYDRGEFRPDGPVQPGWLLTYRALAEAAGDPRIIIDKMQKVNIGSRHHVQGNAGDILDTMLAAEAIGPWLKSETEAFPEIPALASGKLKTRWPEWQTLAETIKAGGEPGALDKTFTRRGMAAELFYAKGDQSKLLALIAAEKNPGYRQQLEADFMARFDRLCSSSLYFPGDALFLRNSTIHRFDALSK